VRLIDAGVLEAQSRFADRDLVVRSENGMPPAEVVGVEDEPPAHHVKDKTAIAIAACQEHTLGLLVGPVHAGRDRE